MEVDITKNQANYPLVILPEEILDHINGNYNNEDLWEANGVNLPSSIDCAYSKGLVLFDKISINTELIKRTKLDFYSLNHDSNDHHLETFDFFIGDFKIPNKPKFKNETNLVKEKFSWKYGFQVLGIFAIIMLISTIFWLTIGTPIIAGIVYILKNSTSFIINPVLVSIMINFLTAFLFFNYHSRYWKLETTFTTTFLESKSERNEKIEKYKNEVNEFFLKANIALKAKKDYIKEEIELNKIALEEKILKTKLNNKSLNLIPLNNTKRGKSELFFLKYLYNQFGKNIKIDLGFEMSKSFSPDFVLFDDYLGIYVDIEIDEPYTLESGEAIHHERTRDSSRNQFFLNYSWIVIRFSERQIIESPLMCVDFIQDTLYAVRKKNSIVESKINSEPCWTYEEAILMKERNERNSYIKRNS